MGSTTATRDLAAGLQPCSIVGTVACFAREGKRCAVCGGERTAWTKVASRRLRIVRSRSGARHTSHGTIVRSTVCVTIGADQNHSPS